MAVQKTGFKNSLTMFESGDIHALRDSNFLMAFSIAGTFLLKADHCSSVKLIPKRLSNTLYINEVNK